MLGGLGGGDLIAILLPISWKCRRGRVLPFRTERGGDKREIFDKLLTFGLLCAKEKLFVEIPVPGFTVRLRVADGNDKRDTPFADTTPTLVFILMPAPDG